MIYEMLSLTVRFVVELLRGEQHIRVRNLVLPSTSLFILLSITCTHAQAQGNWTVSAGGQSVSVDAQNSFVLTNISVTDQFGPGGLGTAPDQQSDGFYRLTGTRVVGGYTQYLRSPPFRLTPNVSVPIPALIVSEYPFPSLASMNLSPTGTVTLDIDATFELDVSGLLSDGTTIDLNPSDAGTTFSSTNFGIARVDSVGLVTAVSPGEALIMVVNEGITAVKKVRVRQPTIETTVQGFVLTDDGAAVAGASISRDGRIVANSGSDGAFTAVLDGIPSNLLAVVLDAEVIFDEVELAGSSGSFAPVPGGISDAGIIRVRPPVPSLFRTAEQALTDAAPSAIESHDLNGDGRSDVVIWSQLHARVTVLMSATQGGLAPPSTYDVPLRPSKFQDYSPRVWIRDVDGDSIADVFVEPGIGPDVYLLQGLGDGSFAPASAISIDEKLYISASALGDLDGDGDVDHLRCGSLFTGPVVGSVVLANGDGSFAPPLTVDLADAGYVDAMVTVNLDGDPAEEVLLSGYVDKNVHAIYVMEGITDAQGPEFQPVFTEGYAGGLLLADFDADGFQDLAVHAYGFDSSAILLGNGAGSFDPPIPLPESTGSEFEEFRTADLDLDGRLDVIALGEGVVTTFRGLGDGSFQAPARGYWWTYSSGRPSFVLVDVLEDAAPDLLTLDEFGGSVFALPGLGDGTFVFPFTATSIEIECRTKPRERRLPTGYFYSAQFEAGDLNGDGIVDLVAWYYCDFEDATRTSVLLGDGRGSFALSQQFGTTDRVLLRDVEPDGDLDLVFSSKTSLRSRLNDGAGVFGEETASAPSENFLYLIEMADCDGNGVQDALVYAYTKEGEQIAIARGVGNGTFLPAQAAISVDNGLYAWSLADMNGDGRIDVCIATYERTYFLTTWLNDGLGGFAPSASYPISDPGFCGVQILLVDVDGDGVRDAILGTFGCSGQAHLILRGVGDGSFDRELELRLDSLYAITNAIDLDLDGRTDFLGIDANTTSLGILRSSTGYQPETYPVLFDFASPTVFDADGDGDLDAVLESYSGSEELTPIVLTNVTRDPRGG